MSKKTLKIKSGGQEPFIVGLGASAGGIPVLKEFFEKVPEDSGMAYVVILHLSPHHESRLAEVLQVTAHIPVKQVTEKVMVKANHVYVVPPNRHLVMKDGAIAVLPNAEVEDRRAPIDIFFRTLADSHGEKAVCVVLSGTGANGSMGLKRIKERGGAAFVQDPEEAEFDEMPRHSIATGLVDEILPVAAIPKSIIAYREKLVKIEIPIEPEKQPDEQQKALREIFRQLRLHTGHDFSNYKRTTVLRRIARRISVRNLPDLPAYAEFVKVNTDEVIALLKDLLISVTNFFRDQQSFDEIRQSILPKLMKDKNSSDQLRIWVAGCATGEEAYSIAMLCAELSEKETDMPRVQIFATDIDESALTQARQGLYTINDAADVSPGQLNHFFNKENGQYRIRHELREMILFANHNFIKDPPFSHLDLVTSRNVMIYLNQEAQERTMETFHFALRPGGYLFLGLSESVDGASDLYSVVSRKHHIFQSRKVGARVYPVPESVPNFFIGQYTRQSVVQKRKASDRITFSELHQQLLENYAPPSVIINEAYEIVHLSDHAGRYMVMAGGEPSQNLMHLIQPDLRPELRSALYQAVHQNTNIEARNLKVRLNSHTETINLHIRPVFKEGDPAQGFILILFEKSDNIKGKEAVLTSSEPVTRQLEEELDRLKKQLGNSDEQHEIQAEELKASNEELQAMNEELRSAAEELETSKEELQSVNEELVTVNQELKVKIDEAVQAGNNLRNLINSTNIPVIFLDRGFRVNLFSPPASELFNLIAADHGRSLSGITHKLEYKDLQQDAERVLEKLHTIKREVQTTDKRIFIMHVLPYRTSEDKINGVVITFMDITAAKEADATLHKNMDELTRFNRAMVSRESRMIQLKKEVNELCKRLGEEERYRLDFEK